MNRLVFAVVALVPALAAAQPSSDELPPQNEAWSNVSHINGQLVPVGERDNYLLASKKTNIATNPIGWLFGFYGVSVSEAVTNNIAIRVDANYINWSPGGIFDGVSGYEAGVSMPIYLKRTYYGPFIEPGMIVRDLTTTQGCLFECDATPMATRHTTIAPEMLVGYHWTFDSGLNLAVALGASRDLNVARTTDGAPQDDGLSAEGYFRVGYAY